MKSKGYFISGTDTSVGKTVVTACLLALYRKRRVDLGVMKPVET
ncbi:MAG TPA: dethiobiotin synthase, partial [Nitrospinaceae bacterium]|nr:dethiobiotin synthase [Nitrospinaceae bacterium]